MKKINAPHLLTINTANERLATLGGHGHKTLIDYDGATWIVKQGDPTPRRDNHPSDDSYRDSPRSEWLGCHVFEHFGIPVQETMMATRNDEPVCLCKLFTTPRLDELVHFRTLLREEQLYRPKERSISLKLLNDTLTKSPRLDPIRLAAIDAFWKTTIVDAIIGNYDRHSDNWGYIQAKAESGKYALLRPAPVYDCGSTFTPAMDRETMARLIQHPDKLEDHVRISPMSVVRKGKRALSYPDLLMTYEATPARRLLYDMADSIATLDIDSIIDKCPEAFDETYRQYYKGMVAASVKVNVQPAYDLACREHGLPHRDLAEELAAFQNEKATQQRTFATTEVQEPFDTMMPSGLADDIEASM